ncbi:hypothetical protein CJ030_MR0G008580 [Morella rubra]|uniref:Uncharacterized protein n=1 Tax=Morella rubra TaxID=262757 RepID=A0A6A1UIL2_9ROSI|nr:hypothetical protein CJ030_MR0G008580 [Morella rubra]
MRRQSPINVDRRHEEEFPLWFRNRDDVMPAGGKRLRCDSLVRAESSLRRSAINKENRAKLKIVHTSERGPSNARSIVRKNEALQLQYESEGKSYTKWRFSLRCWGRKRVTCEV